MDVLFLVAQKLGRDGVEAVAAELLSLLNHDQHVEDDAPIDVNRDDLASLDLLGALTGPGVHDSAQSREVEIDLLSLGPVKEVRNIELRDVVTCNDVGVDHLEEVSEAHQEVLFPLESEDLRTGHFAASVQIPDRLNKPFVFALLFDVDSNLDHWTSVCARETLAWVVTLNIEGKDSDGRNLEHVDSCLADLLEVHVDFQLRRANFGAGVPNLEGLDGDPASSGEVSVDHVAQREGDVSLVGRVARKDVSVLEG
mmetsp:Transcript_75821/g.158060  ORF Transcript_75821/g.158060 Transcript_75821/m.158060 type:complete len:254 (-) Transcript_75821:655-1416(-)